ncbi:DUF4199 domain-containing protein [Tenacibaculum piscium]|uniref:50S ribosomal protein L31 type B n=1 Tax=Tenacibaculum piscium TaxID=1458515 RepID=A0A2H1YGZ4_9FLAO|nr:DUF4199 domain-containing protein [Tenacibaculum piscium]MBE7630229.1 DUF4199 family protein [Tenacibaculum piscium]MBE7670912.1 DUF4199 family protein [Tenacibaculum piscium]MBE7685751.1 DUF4199 family protein [Tenacibaculum piscium]MBE7690257.1 DUF4199 family protein [Tenacibaculum piscium]MCG8184096.1 DUF4199 domain-containing protein [Tenacibaculum piscium]
MENQVQSRRIILNYGLVYGGIIVFINLLIYALGMTFDTLGGIINMIALAVCIIALPILAIKKFKKENNGFLIWGQALKIGVGIVAVGAVISIVYTHLFTGIIEPDFYNQLTEFQTEKFLEAGLTDDQIESQLAMQAKFQGTIIGDSLGLLFYVFLGFIVSAIAGAVMKHTQEDEY